MRFNSVAFIGFFLAFIVVWPILRRRNSSRWIYLIVASSFFYGWWDYRFLFLILASGLIDFFAALAMERRSEYKKWFLVVSICGNVGSLALFKYLDFFIMNLNYVGDFLGFDAEIPLARLILPVGISFYTFQSMSYTIDVYRGKLNPTRNPFHFFAYLAMFPQLVAGPIVRATDLLPQLMRNNPTTEENRWQGLRLIAYGYFKKVVVADNLAPLVNAAFDAQTPVDSAGYWWVIIFFFALQIYCDFSGYSDIARGLGKWMGFEFPVNFDHPYLSGSLREFWGRWHVSLSSWFRDYVYIPLGGSRKGTCTGHRNMWITMLISGLWHGAAWTFVGWAALHALYLSIERLTQWPKRLIRLPGGRHLCVAITFILVLCGWVFFRARSFTQATVILGEMFNLGHMNFKALPDLFQVQLLIPLATWLTGQVYVYLNLSEQPFIKNSPWVGFLRPLALGAIIAACIFFKGPGSTFIYFQF
ncbi:MBOAT family O-acyltransferase [Planctomycetota bacterium]